MNRDAILAAAGGGFELKIVDRCASTNDALKAGAAGLAAPFVLIADRQTGGRGRLGRGFYSPGGTGLYMSLLLRPRLDTEDLPLLTPAAAVAVAGAAEELFGVEAGIKWVNDLYVRGKKVCGILTESAIGPGGPEYAVVGIGVNVCPPEGGWPEELAGVAGSLLDRWEPDARERLAAGVLRRFFALLPELPGTGFSEDYRRRLLYVGEKVTVIRPDGAGEALVLGADNRCGLRVRRPDGTEETLTGGEITLRPAGGAP